METKPLIEQIKEFIGLETSDTTKDNKLNHWIALVELEITSYCGIPELPTMLHPVVVDIVSNVYEEVFDPKVTELKEGENSYKFNIQKIRSRIKDYKDILDNYTTM